MIKLSSVSELLSEKKLHIPPYQRPYMWNIKNISDLLIDISNSIENKKLYGEFKYRLGTVILHENGDNYDIVDGQQRVISLVLLMKCLNPDFTCPILNEEFENKITQQNIYKNYFFMKEWLTQKNLEEDFKKAFSNILEIVCITVNNETEAFQLFDSQNTRGKSLDPHDLLKAYHLREMKNYPYEMKYVVNRWEANDTKQIRELFDMYLYPIWNWSHGKKTNKFTDKEIDTFKGISLGFDYTYAKRVDKASPYFQISEPFIAGYDFFEMVEHYIGLLHDIKTEIEENKSLEAVKSVLDTKTNSVGFGYAKNLFYCALLCYYDKFHNFDVMAVKKICLWSFMLRVDMKSLGFDSINKYAVGESGYTNEIPMFSKIKLARLHTEISDLQVEIKEDKQEKQNKQNWLNLCEKLKELKGGVYGSNK